MDLNINIWFLLFLMWGLPLTYYRSKFRKTVYMTNKWTINIKPLFTREIKALFGNIYPNSRSYLKIRNFYRFYLIIYFLLFTSYMAFPGTTKKNENMKRIEIGDKIPQFELKDQNGENFSMNSIIGKKKIVLFFYPKDDTPGCTKEACLFRDHYDAFVQAGAEVIGISGQSVKSHKDFAIKHNLSYRILSDEGNKIRKRFGVPSNMFGLLPGRVTYVIDKSGVVVHTFNSQSDISGHINESLEILNKIN